MTTANFLIGKINNEISTIENAPFGEVFGNPRGYTANHIMVAENLKDELSKGILEELEMTDKVKPEEVTFQSYKGLKIEYVPNFRKFNEGESRVLNLPVRVTVRMRTEDEYQEVLSKGYNEAPEVLQENNGSDNFQELDSMPDPNTLNQGE